MRPLAGTLCSIALLAVFGLALALAGGETTGRSPAPSGTPAAPGLDREALARIAAERTPVVARRVERIRGLRFRAVPEPRLRTTAELRELAAAELEGEAAAAELRADELTLRLFGMLDSDDDLIRMATELTAQAAAYYDPRSGELFVVSDAVPAGPEVTEFVLAHELTHALEDQRFGLPGRAAVSDQRQLARSALFEGTATAVMIEYARRHLDLMALGSEAAGVGTGGLDDLPEFVQRQAEFTYLGGAELVDRLRARAGPSAPAVARWRAVDHALARRPPRTTEQVLHPDAYVRDEGPLPVRVGAGPGPGWRALDTDAIGELMTAEILRVGVDGELAERAVSGWGGNRYRVWARAGAEPDCGDRCRAEAALLARWRADSVAEARELLGALVLYVVQGLGGEPSNRPLTWALGDGWAAIASRGDAVSLAFAPSERLARRLAAGPGG